MALSNQERLLQFIRAGKRKYGAVPKPEILAGWASVSLDEARAAISGFHEDPVTVASGPGHRITLRQAMDFLLDGGALLLAVAIDLVLNAVVFWVIAPDLITRIGMVCLSFIVVLFSLRGWMKGGVIGRSLWAMFALVATFSDLSFALSATDLQANGSDPEITRLDDQLLQSQQYLEKLQNLQITKGEGYAQQIREAVVARDAASKSRRDYVSPGKQMSSSKVFTAIPDAVTTGRWIQLAFFLLIFAGLQLTIVSSATKVVTH